MEFINTIDLKSLADSAVSFAVAFILGGLIGYERELRQSRAGLRTNVLVALGAAIFVDIANRYYGIHGGNYGTVHVIAYVVSGVGFLGAGVIMREGGDIRGLNTAATLWSSAAVGCAAGADLILEALLGASFILFANILLRPVIAQFAPKAGGAASAANKPPKAPDKRISIEIVAEHDQSIQILELLHAALEPLDERAQGLQIQALDDAQTQISASLDAAATNPAALNALMARLGAHPAVRNAQWSSNAA